MHSIRQRFRDLALNLWWTWQPDVIELFRDLDPQGWRETNHNPLAVLLRLDDEALRHQAADHSLKARLNFQFRRLQEYLMGPNLVRPARADAAD